MSDLEDRPHDDIDRRPLVLVLLALLALPLAVVLIRFRFVPWSPILDLAWTELRVRDVGTIHTPLIGLPGRIGTLPNVGSHPGPLSFYLLAPIYRLLGSTAWALQASCVSLQVGWIAAALLIARRRGGPALVAGVGATLAALMTGYGFSILAEPWNPYLPVLAWFVFLLAVWSVVCGDTVMLPVAAVAGTFCAETHVSYLPLTTGVGALTFGAAVVQARSRSAAQRRRFVQHALLALATCALAWTPPIVDQLIHTPGNLRVLITYFGHPTEATIGMRAGLDLALERMDLYHLFTEQLVVPGNLCSGLYSAPGTFAQAWFGHAPSRSRGVATTIVWLVAAATAWRQGSDGLPRLHAVVGVTLLLGIVVLSRIFGMAWYYLMLWMWGVAALAAIAIGWTAAAVLVRLLGPARAPRVHPICTTALLLATTLFAVHFSIAATTAEHWSKLGDIMPALATSSARALEEWAVYGQGRERRYLVQWSDTMNGGAQGFALLNELERLGLRVGVPASYGALATPHRVLEPQEADASILLANGGFIDRYRKDPKAVEIAFIDPRSPEERREFETLRTEVLSDLRAANLTKIARDVDANLFAASLTPGIGPETQQRMARMLTIGTASAVFMVPPKFPLPFSP